MRLDLGISTSQLPLAKLMMTPVMQNGLKMLQMNRFELEDFLTQEAEENPLLEFTTRCSTGSDLPLDFPENISLYQHLKSQVFETFLLKIERETALTIIGNLDEKGYLDNSSYKETDDFKKILEKVQEFDPPGIAARSLQECLLLQLRAKGKEKTISYRVIQFHYQDFIHHHFSTLEKKLHISASKIQKDIDQNVKPLYMHPARIYGTEPNPTVEPDVEITEQGNVLVLSPFDQLELKQEYVELLKTSLPVEEKSSIREWKTKGFWLKRNLSRRKKLLESIGKYIAKNQRAYLKNLAPLAPLSIKKSAVELNIHESTLLRALNQKHLKCAKGQFLLRHFFSSEFKNKGVSKKAILLTLKALIDNEQKKDPFSDEEIRSKLKEKGYDISRRCVAKYRDKLKIAPKHKRRKYY